MLIKNQVLLCLIIIGLCFRDAMCKVFLDHNMAGSSQDILMMDPYIEVSATSKHFDFDQYDLVQFKFVEMGKNKRKTYGGFIRKYNKIVECLVKNKIIPFAEFMIHSPIQMNFGARKKVWEFSRVFTIYSTPKHLELILQYLEPFKLINLQDRRLFGDFSLEKLMVIEAFLVAKEKLSDFIKNKVNSKFQIVSVISMEIETQNVGSSNIDSNPIKGNIEVLLKNIEQICYIKNKVKKQQQKQFNNIAIKIVFQIGQHQTSSDKVVNDDTDQQQSQEEDNTSNESSFKLEDQQDKIVFQ